MGKKRELEEIEVDVTQPAPLSKKQKRLLKKGKIEAPEPKPLDEPKPAATPARSQYAVWIGNLNFDTTPVQLREFIIESTAKLESPVVAEDITRLKMPAKKGFAYVDVKTEPQMKSIVSLSESRLGNRNILIKDARSFEGRPAAAGASASKNPPSRILFVGNLSFDTTDAELEQHFQHCGDIQKIRTATFEDTGKCKGFSFIDFTNEEAATKALGDKRCRKLNGRTLRMEYGEDRSKRRPKSISSSVAEPQPESAQERTEPLEPSQRIEKPRKQSKDKASRPKHRPTPGAALMSAERGRQSVLPSTGKKVTFD